jgi:hypothetical protein
MSQDNSGAALQRIRRLWVQVRDGPRVLEDFVTHDKFWIGRRGRLESEDMGTARGELPAGRPREVEVQERADCLDVVPLPRAIGLILTSGHGDVLRSLPHRARAALRAAALRCFVDSFRARAFPPWRPSARRTASTADGSFFFSGLRFRAMAQDATTPHYSVQTTACAHLDSVS